MKQTIKLVDKVNNKTIEAERTIRDLAHFETQQKTKSVKFRDKTKYTRKKKHKGADYEA